MNKRSISPTGVKDRYAIAPKRVLLISERSFLIRSLRGLILEFREYFDNHALGNFFSKDGVRQDNNRFKIAENKRGDKEWEALCSNISMSSSTTMAKFLMRIPDYFFLQDKNISSMSRTVEDLISILIDDLLWINEAVVKKAKTRFSYRLFRESVKAAFLVCAAKIIVSCFRIPGSHPTITRFSRCNMYKPDDTRVEEYLLKQHPFETMRKYLISNESDTYVCLKTISLLQASPRKMSKNDIYPEYLLHGNSDQNNLILTIERSDIRTQKNFFRYVRRASKKLGLEEVGESIIPENTQYDRFEVLQDLRRFNSISAELNKEGDYETERSIIVAFMTPGISKKKIGKLSESLVKFDKKEMEFMEEWKKYPTNDAFPSAEFKQFCLNRRKSSSLSLLKSFFEESPEYANREYAFYCTLGKEEYKKERGYKVGLNGYFQMEKNNMKELRDETPYPAYVSSITKVQDPDVGISKFQRYRLKKKGIVTEKVPKIPKAPRSRKTVKTPEPNIEMAVNAPGSANSETEPDVADMAPLMETSLRSLHVLTNYYRSGLAGELKNPVILDIINNMRVTLGFKLDEATTPVKKLENSTNYRFHIYINDAFFENEYDEKLEDMTSNELALYFWRLNRDS